VALLDIGLPGLSGYEVAQRLRQDPTLAGLVLVAVTGWGTEDDQRRSAQAGFDHHLTKPVEAAALEAVLARRGQTQAG
jgi:CheY-like chemotaxis protein